MMFDYRTQIRVRYADTDQMAFVYYGNYARYFEIARVEALRSLGISYRKLEEAGVMMPVLENYSKYLRPAFYDDLIEIKVMIKEMPGIRIRFDYEIFRESGELIHTGYTLLAFVSVATKKLCNPPEEVLQALSGFFKKSKE
jgi:acyl-CoA thioester hydrolase